MMPRVSLLRRALARLSRSRREDDLREEIEAHIAARRRSLIDEGMDPREAAYEARRIFGNVAVIREETRDMWSFRWMDTLAQDLRYGIRLLRKSPVFTVAAIGSLALGIGASAAVFSLTDRLMLRPLPVTAPDQLVLLRWSSGPQSPFESLNGNGTMTETQLSSTSFSYVAYDTMRKSLAQDVELFAFADIYQANLAVDGHPDTAYGQVASGNYFQVLGITAAAGRLLGPADDRRDAPPAAVLGYDFWIRRFGGSPDVVGRQLVLNGVSFTIAGVLPRGFSGTLQVAQRCDVVVPMAMYGDVTHAENNLQDPNYWWILMMGRLKNGASRERVQNAADAILKQTVSAAKTDLKPDALPRVSVEPGHRGQTETRSTLVEPLQIMAAVVGVVLLVACANVANLLLARGRARSREIAVRAAIGAPRQRIIGQLLTEGMLLGGIASALGLLIARWITHALLPALESDGGTLGLAFALDWRIVAFTCLLALVCSVGFSLAPAIRASDAHITTGLQESTRGAVGSRRRFSAAGTLVVVQVALSMLLVSAAGLLTWSAYKLQKVQLGFDPNNLLTFSIDTSLNGYDAERTRIFVENALEQLRALPGVIDASVSSHRLISNSSSIGLARAAGTPAPAPGSREVAQWAQQHRAYRLNVENRFLDTMRIPLLRGRNFGSADTKKSPPVAIINVSLANQLFGTADAVGKRMILGLRPGNPEVEIVGVVPNAMYTSVRQADLPIAYLPIQQEPLNRVTFEVRTAGDPVLVTSVVRDSLRRLDATLPIFDIRTQSEQILRSLERERLFARLSLLLGGITLALSGIGLYGLLAYAVTRRTPEIGVRMALGAARGQVRWMVLRQSLILVAAGLAIGIPGAAWSARLLESLLFGLSATDARVLAAASLVMLAVALLAAYVPARRASRIDPLTALRAD